MQLDVMSASGLGYIGGMPGEVTDPLRVIRLATP